MSLMAIILWALHALSPWRQMYERAHNLLKASIRYLHDPDMVGWLCANPDNPSGIALIERGLDVLSPNIDLLIYQRAREILGLKPVSWATPRRSPPQ
ncbi:MAG TPA: hypothetical protein VGO52_21340, partial [Hyphomonadaceae bacterium]|nr:hypothetical protein [Hyphomonadaceae bacterium]